MTSVGIKLIIIGGVFIILGMLYDCGTHYDEWEPPSGGITILQDKYLFKYTLHEIHVTHTGGITDTTYVYRVLCQEAD